MRTRGHSQMLTILLCSVLTGYAQNEIEHLETEMTVQCIPESLSTVYDEYLVADPDPTQLKMWYSFGSEYFKHEEYTSALPYLWKAFIHDTSKIGMYSIRKIADAYFTLKYADSTLIACYRGLDKFPDLENLHYYAGYLQVNLGKYQCAIPHYEFLVERNPGNESYLDKLAFLYFKNEDEKAIEIQTRLAELYPDNSEYQKRLIVYLEHFNYDAIQAIRNAFEKDSTNLENAKRLGRAELDAGNYEQAVSALTIALKLDSTSVEILKLRAQGYEALRKYISAINDLKTILKLKANDIDVLCSIATQYKLLNRFGESAFWVKKAITTDPDNGLPHIVMAEIYEAAVPFCQSIDNRGRKIDDGLVYEKAVQQYQLALQDLYYSAYARRRIELLEPFLPTTEEIFFNPDKKIKSECYTSWIEDDQSE